MAAERQSEGETFSDEYVSQVYPKGFGDARSEDEVPVAAKEFSEYDGEWSCVAERVLDVLIEMKNMKEKEEKRKTRAEDDEGRARRLRKAARRSWARLATEGVQSILACPCPVQSSGVRGESWGYLSYSDVLLLNEAKYDAAIRSLCLDMLREHHSAHVWEALAPWQRENEVLWLEELADEALASDDMIALAELPGAFTIYRSYPEPRDECFTAVSLLYKLNACRRQEREELTALVEKLDESGLRLLCLHIRSATLRAQREKKVFSAYLAVRQSWGAWPLVHSPCREEQAAALLRSDDHAQEHRTDFNSQSSRQVLQNVTIIGNVTEVLGKSRVEHFGEPLILIFVRALLQLLVLTQQQERKQLVRLLRGVTLEEVQRPVPTDSAKTSCIKKLQQICSTSENQPQRDISGPPTEWSQGQLERASLVLLTQFLEMQERQTSAFLSALLDENEHPPVLTPEYRSRLGAEHLRSNLLQLLNPDSSFSNSSSPEQVPHQSCSRGPAEAQNLSGSQTGADAISAKPHRVRAEDVPDQVPDRSKTDGEGGEDEEWASTTKEEEQDSLIPLAWSTQLENDTGQKGVPAHAVADQMRHPDEGAPAVRALGANREEELNRPQLAERHCGPQELHLEERPNNQNGRHANLVRGQQALLDSLDVKPAEEEGDMWKDLGAPEPIPQATRHCIINERNYLKAPKERIQATEPVSAVEREKTVRKLVDVHRRVERKQQRNRERQQLRVRERLSIIQSKKGDEDLVGPKYTEKIRNLSKDLPQEDKSQHKTMVREQLETLRRERSFIMQCRRKRNTAGFKELLGPVNLQSRETEDMLDQDNNIQ